MSIANQRSDFSITEFSRLITEKGYDLIHEKAVLCSCINDEGQNLASCTYCNNTGRRYVIESTKIKAVLTGVNKSRDLSETGISSTGIVNITTYATNRLSFMDRLTLLDGKIVYNEVISNDAKVPNLKYPVLEIEYVGSLYKNFVKEVDYDLIDGVFTWLRNVNEPYSIRYITYPVFIILTFPNIIRGTLTKLKSPSITYCELPVHAIGKLEFKITDTDIS